MVAAMPRKKGTKKHFPFQETEAKSCESDKIPETKHACIVEAHESTKQRLELSLPEDHEDHIAGKGYNPQIGAQFYSHASSDQNSGCESSSGQGMEEARNDSSLAVGQCKEQKKNYSGSTKRQKESPLCYIDGQLPSKKMRG